jgi:hypothetical protein
MRPYLAVILDSFHEAFASRVLWILLALTCVFLLALAPLGVTEQPASRLGQGELRDGADLLRFCAEEAALEAPSPGKHLYGRLSDKLRRTLATPLPAAADRRRADRLLGEKFRDELNDLLPANGLFDEAAWHGIALPKEAADLKEQGLAELPAAQLARFNRLALEAAFPGDIASSGQSQLQMSYLTWEVGVPLPVGRDALAPTINTLLQVVMQLVLGIGGVLVAILVTASVIPLAFEAGAIDLLLSKPVSRPLVFLARFFGGCAFILIISSLLIGGLWLILGTRFGLWNERLLWCIPLYLFLFAIYFSVSAFAGLVWRNAIVAVVITILFWAACFSVGLTRDFIDRLFLNPERIVRLVAAGDDVVATNEVNQVLRWNQDAAAWEETFQPLGGQPRVPFGMQFRMPVVGPVYDSAGGRILAADRPFPQMGMFNVSSTLWIGRPDENWVRIAGAQLPQGVEAIVVSQEGAVLAVTPAGIYRCQGDAEKPAETMEAFGIEVVVPDSGGEFVAASPELKLSTPLSVAADATAAEIGIYDGRTLTALARGADGGYSIRRQVPFSERQAGLLAAGDGVWLLALADGQVQFLERGDLRLIETWRPSEKLAPRFVAASPDGRWLAVVFHDRQFRLFDAATRQEVARRWPGQGDISAAAFAADGRLLLANHVNRVTAYQPGEWQADRTWRPAMGTWETLYRYAINPLYIVFPKPGELNRVIAWILNDETTVANPFGPSNLSDVREQIDVAGPIWSNLAFLSLVLLLGCVYVARKDF